MTAPPHSSDDQSPSPPRIYHQEFYLYSPVLPQSTNHTTTVTRQYLVDAPGYLSSPRTGKYFVAAPSYLPPPRTGQLPILENPTPKRPALSSTLIAVLAVFILGLGTSLSNLFSHNSHSRETLQSIVIKHHSFDFAKFNCTKISVRDFMEAGLAPMVYNPRYSHICLYSPADPQITAYYLQIARENQSMAEWGFGSFHQVMCLGICTFNFSYINKHPATIVKQSFSSGEPWVCYLYVTVDATHGVSFILNQEGIPFEDVGLQKIAQKLIP